MRTKRIPVRSVHRSPRKSLASLPDEANEMRTTNCDPQFDSGDADVEIVPDTFDKRDVPLKKRYCLGTSQTGIGGLEPLNLDACIVCEISDKRVSRCSGIDCIISFHGECLNSELGGGDDLENSYCPYCWYKVLALKYKSAREKAVEAEKAVIKYLDKEMKSKDGVKENDPETLDDSILSGEENENQEHSVENTDIVIEQVLQGQKDTYSRGEKMPLIEEIDQPEENEDKLGVGTDKSEERAATESFQDAEGHEKAEGPAGAGKKGEASPFLSMQESFSGKEQDHVQQNEKRTRRRRLVLNTVDSDISSNESTNERNEEDATEKIASSTQVTSPQGKMKNQQRKKLTAKPQVAKPKTVRDISFFKKDQRRRLLWTFEEEEMLKVGVEKFAAEANKNMPWRKILEMGEKVFHETRTPADLKDKWRNMMK